MRRLALLLLVLLVGFALLGLLGVFVPPHVSAATPVDRTCMHALRHEGYTFEQRRRKCRIRVRTVGYHAAQVEDDGYWKWRVGNFMWQFKVEVSYDKYPSGAWRILSTECWQDYAYVVTLRLTRCGTWYLGDGDRAAGAAYEVSFGPVSRGGRTYITFYSDGHVSTSPTIT